MFFFFSYYLPLPAFLTLFVLTALLCLFALDLPFVFTLLSFLLEKNLQKEAFLHL